MLRVDHLIFDGGGGVQITQMFRIHFKAHQRFLGFSLTKGIPAHERIAVQNICMRSSSRLGEICS